jgi:membrane protein implicated in regulation of membrane protease activity
MLTNWLIIAAILAGAEMFSGTFYLLVLALGAGAGALAAHFNQTLEIQIGAAAVVAVLGYIVLRQVRPPKPPRDAAANPDLNIDIGTTVRLADVLADGTVRVTFRGTTWNARIDGAAPDANKTYQIARIEGATLILTPQE